MFGMNLANFIAGQEWIFIIVIAVVLIFGAKKFQNLQRPLVKQKVSLRKARLKAKKNLKTSKIKKQNQINFQQF